MKKAFKSNLIYDQQVVSRDSIPMSLKEVYQSCDAPPELSKLNKFRDDNKDGLKFYTDPNYFFDLWKQQMIKETKEFKLNSKISKSKSHLQTPNQNHIKKSTKTPKHQQHNQQQQQQQYRQQQQQQQQQQIAYHNDVNYVQNGVPGPNTIPNMQQPIGRPNSLEVMQQQQFYLMQQQQAQQAQQQLYYQQQEINYNNYNQKSKLIIQLTFY